MKTKKTDQNVGMRWRGRNINQCMGDTEFLRCGCFYFAVAVRHSQLDVAETLDNVQWFGKTKTITDCTGSSAPQGWHIHMCRLKKVLLCLQHSLKSIEKIPGHRH